MTNRRKISAVGLAIAGAVGCSPRPEVAYADVFPRIETSFSIPHLASDPFDYEKTDVRVSFRRVGGGSIWVPAFFDGDTTWKARYTPTERALYRVESVTLNDQRLTVTPVPREWQVTGAGKPGFIQVDPKDKTRFVYGNGSRYYPFGHNQAWRTNGLPDIPEMFAKMAGSRENWSRVWMNQWDGKNLDWPKPGPFGTLDLKVARRWDSIVDAAETNSIAFQMTLQHHGQYSTEVNPNWDDCPYNVKNGGFLSKPEEFFTSPQAKALTKRKLRYAVARWGYSPAIMAWELFNEVQFTDAARHGHWKDVAAWHTEMAAFLRQQDPFHHLITTSSTEAAPAPVWAAMDYYQEHTYPADLLTALYGDGQHNDKPYFVGEYGPANLSDAEGQYLHAGLWTGLMSGRGGAPQYWTWDEIEKHNLYSHFSAAGAFLAASRLAEQAGLRRTLPSITTSQRSSLAFGPAAGWVAAKQSEFIVESSGPPVGIGGLPQFLQGNNHRDMSPKPLTFQVDYPQAGRFEVTLDKVAKSGAHLKLTVDNQEVERNYAAADADYTPNQASLGVEVPMGKHTITLENVGVDWVVIKRFALTNYSPALGGYALCGSDYAAAWVYHRANVILEGPLAPAAAGTVTLSSLKPGKYRAHWLDTRTGKQIRATVVTVAAGSSGLSLKTPEIVRDVALFVQRC